MSFSYVGEVTIGRGTFLGLYAKKSSKRLNELNELNRGGNQGSMEGRDIENL
jgi:hypothetical protein